MAAAIMNSDIVIKIKYGETRRRFHAYVVDGGFDLTMDELRDKIIHLFNFSNDTDFTLTCIDENNDVITLVDDDDLSDVISQALNPLRITVKLSTERSGKSSPSSSSSSSSPSASSSVRRSSETNNKQLASPWFQQHVKNLNSQDLLRIFTELIAVINNLQPVHELNSRDLIWIFTEFIALMNELLLGHHQYDSDAPVHGRQQSINNTVTARNYANQSKNNAAGSGSAPVSKPIVHNFTLSSRDIDMRKLAIHPPGAHWESKSGSSFNQYPRRARSKRAALKNQSSSSSSSFVPGHPPTLCNHELC